MVFIRLSKRVERVPRIAVLQALTAYMPAVGPQEKKARFQAMQCDNAGISASLEQIRLPCKAFTSPMGWTAPRKHAQVPLKTVCALKAPMPGMPRLRLSDLVKRRMR